MTLRLFAKLAVLSLLLLALQPGAAFAQQAVDTATVTIRTMSAFGAVEGVVITAASRDGPTRSGLTDADGVTTLRLPAGSWSVTAERLGFAHAEVTLALEPARDTTLVIDLAQEVIETEGIVVTSGRTERRIEEEPIRIEAVSREELEEKLLMTPGDIGMLLNETAGLRVQPTAPSLGGASVRIQGLRGRYTQILTDGMPLYGGQAGALGPLQVPPMDLARVEVIKGAASALYGPTALGGVVNLISRRPDPARELILNQSTLDGTDVVGWLADELGEPWGYTLLASAHRQDYADVNDDGWADVPDFERVSVRPRLFWDDGAGSSAIFTVGGMAEDRAGGTLPGEVAPDGSPYAESLDTRRIDTGLSLRKVFSSARVLSARVSGSLQSHEHRFGDRLEEDEHRTGFAEVALSGQDGRHLWVLGLAIQHDGYAHDQFPAFDFDYTVPAIFAQDEIDLSEWLTAAVSLRYDDHSRYGGVLSPRVSVLARAAEWTTRVSAGTGFFAPTPFTEEVEAVGIGRLNQPGEWVEERARSGMVDIGRTFGPLEVNASAFGSVIDDPLQTIRESDGTLTIRNASEGSVETWGTEVFAALRTGPWRLIGSHAFLRSTEPTPDGPGRREVPLTPRHSVGVVGAYEREDWGRVGIEAYFTGRQELEDDPYRATSRDHFILGFLIDRKLGPFRLFLNAENVLDTRQTGYDPLLRPSRTPDGRWITDVWAPLEGRAFNGGVWFSF
ncbi:MAG TPA: TonB-dependent receptor [Longimicrobiales bacterium]|nr:TonB-dependent receptor [Longimicrobiales bacterium]